MYRAASLTLALVVALAVCTQAYASPLFRIGEGSSTDWSTAIGSGQVVPSDANTPLTNSLFQQQQTTMGLDNFSFTTPQLTPDLPVPDVFGEIHQAMVMSWPDAGALGGNPPEMDVSIAGWEYVYDVDPDLTDTVIEFSLLPPQPGVWDVGLTLIDSANRERTWIDFGPQDGWGDLELDPEIAGPQGGFEIFGETPGFDLTQVVGIRLLEAGGFSPDFPVDPSGVNLGAWNAWNHLEVRLPPPLAPEPSTLLLCGLLALGALGHALWRRRKRTAV